MPIATPARAMTAAATPPPSLPPLPAAAAAAAPSCARDSARGDTATVCDCYGAGAPPAAAQRVPTYAASGATMLVALAVAAAAVGALAGPDVQPPVQPPASGAAPAPPPLR